MKPIKASAEYTRFGNGKSMYSVVRKTAEQDEDSKKRRKHPKARNTALGLTALVLWLGAEAATSGLASHYSRLGQEWRKAMPSINEGSALSYIELCHSSAQKYQKRADLCSGLAGNYGLCSNARRLLGKGE
ncbi:hypothetical protein KY345_00665 [Candidatus Woesearchaeota archaeon]|nr:hypothetical protein [Candidatus Woesearchaeota archaeon]